MSLPIRDLGYTRFGEPTVEAEKCIASLEDALLIGLFFWNGCHQRGLVSTVKR